uniref:Uncharacterized protein n=1 Tax=Phlebotomus papatasi TaxID=29031 RepID=A0A1B0D0G9_PHLPP
MESRATAIRVENSHNMPNTQKGFKYLGTLINKDNVVSAEIEHRINQGNKAFFALLRLFKSRSLSRSTKIMIYKTVVRPVVLYGCETWTLSKIDEERLAVFERRVLRRIFGPVKDGTDSWRIRHNQEIYSLYAEPNIIGHLKASRLRWAGHLQRMDNARVTKRLYDSKPMGSRRVGRPRITWEQDIDDDARQLAKSKWRSTAMDRE